jgi:hypothetical protein
LAYLEEYKPNLLPKAKKQTKRTSNPNVSNDRPVLNLHEAIKEKLPRRLPIALNLPTHVQLFKDEFTAF